MTVFSRSEPSSNPGSLPAGDVSIDVGGGVVVEGIFRSPEERRGLIVFVHGSSSGRHSPRNTAVAGYLESRGFATLLFDLLTPAEETDRRNTFDIDLLAGRLVDVTDWLGIQPGVASLPVGYFGASTGAAAAIRAAAGLGERISAIVSRGGRPDLAGDALGKVSAPTLLIVGSEDPEVLELNRTAAEMLPVRHEISIVPGAGHLFEEPGTLQIVASLAGDWFGQFLDPGEPGIELNP